jgi:hypothetical protein
MAMLTLPVGSYKLPAPAASCRRLVNIFAEAAPPDRPNKQPVNLIRAPGISAFADLDETEVRGCVSMGGVPFFCAGSHVYSVSSGGTPTQMTGTVTGNGPVRMATNGTDIAICPGNGDGFACDGSSVTEIIDPDFTADGGGADPVFVDSYLVFRRPGTAAFFNSGLGNLNFNGLDIAAAEGAPGNLIGLHVNNRELVLVKDQSSELWYDAGNSTGSPFSRSPNGFKELGCAAGQSLATQDNGVVMLASDRTFRRLADVWTRFSHHGIESILQRMPTISDCLAIPYAQEGHLFVAFTFRNTPRTLVMDFTTGEWHERESRINTVSLGRWRVSCTLQAYGKQLVGDTESGKIGILDPDTHEEWGEPQVVEFAFQPVYADGLRASHRRLELGVSAGQGTSTGQGVNPLITLFVSDDGGNTFRTRPMRELGRIGQYRRRVQWHNLGESRDRVYKLQMSDPVRFMVLDAQLEVDGGRL